jgi:hypothetical protein
VKDFDDRQKNMSNTKPQDTSNNKTKPTVFEEAELL